MRIHPGVMALGLLVACGKVETASIDASGSPPGGDGGGGGDDGAPTDGTPVDAPVGVDAPASVGPQPVLYWSYDNTVNNAGSLGGFALTTPAGIGYGLGKFGQAGQYGNGQYAYVDGLRGRLSSYFDRTIGCWLLEPGTAQGTAFFDCNNRSTSPFGGVQMGLTGTSVAVCVSTTTNSYLSGGCDGFTAPSANTWHHWIMRYDGTGTGTGQGGPTQIYVDNVLVHTRPNDAANNPVWNLGIPDRMYLGLNNASIDDVRVYNQVFSLADQCSFVVRGTWNGASCVLP